MRVSTGARPQGAEYVDETTTEYTIWVDDNYKKEIELFSDAVLNGSALTVSEEESLRAAREAMLLGVTPDAVLTEAEEAMAAIGELTGASIREDITNRIFARFCVGK